MISERQAWQHFAPLQLLLPASLLLFLAVVLSVWFAVSTPWLGLTLKQESDGWGVTAVHPKGPLAHRLHTGDTLRALETEQGMIKVIKWQPDLNPHVLPTFKAFNDYLQFQDQLFQALEDQQVTLLLTDGRRISVSPKHTRSLSSLPLEFWLLHLFGVVAIVIGLAVWVFRPTKPAVRLLALSGLGFFIATWNHSLWKARELALPADLFDLLLRVNHLGLHLMLGALVVLLASYPQRLGRWPIRVIVITVVAVQLNENFQWLDIPLHTFYLPLLLYYLSGVALAIVQWRLAYTSPLDRAALRWVFLSVLLTMGAGMISYFLPLIFGTPPLVGVTTMVGLGVTLYLGFALGVLRYRLFELERWWFIAWIWLLGGLSVLLVDAAVIYAFGLKPAHGLGFALLLVGWVYFPVRQWLWRQLAGSAEVRMEEHLPHFIQQLYTDAETHLEKTWRDLLLRIFQPLALESAQAMVEQPRLRGNGARLEIPAFHEGEQGLSLLYGQGGRRLFSSRDEEIASALVAIASRIGNVRRAQESGMQTERERIQRDLHDDVGGRLLTLVHGSDDARQRNLARKALGALREVTNALDEDQRYSVAELFERWRLDIGERLAVDHVQIEWREQGESGNILLTSRQYINLLRTLDEGVTNALKHADPKKLYVTIFHSAARLRIAICNGGLRPADSEPPHAGRGLHNMRTRMAEIGGAVETLHQEYGGEQCFCLDLKVPLND